MFELEKEIKQVEPNSYIGLDFAMADFYVDSKGNKGKINLSGAIILAP